ncbi:hypothetical protein DL765_010397 [Monosporascus sp. GIB2]|nr:hypothetical protein DL765_010397 [Monosporascus sp. GIB2]
MVKEYIRDDRTIILAVLPSNVDVATQEILELAKRYDKTGDRTLGVLTMFYIEADMASFLSGMSNEDLDFFAKSQDDPVSDRQIKLYIYTCFLMFKASGSTEHPERAVLASRGMGRSYAYRPPRPHAAI